MAQAWSLHSLRKLFLLAAVVTCGVLGAVVAGGREASAHAEAGVVYTLTNAAAGNQVATFTRASDGTLTPGEVFDTGGLGTGSGLGSQGALVLDGSRLLAVNAGSDTISLFRVRGSRLVLEDVEPSGGDMPISITVDGNLVYVLNGGAPENITGFKIRHRSLEPIQHSTRPLSGSGVMPAQVQFSPNGRFLVVTEKATNRIDLFYVGLRGFTFGPVSHASVGQTPFGFAFADRDTLVVSEAFGGAPEASATSSYDLSRFGRFTNVTPSSLTTETAACWTAIPRGGRYAYVTNTGSSSVTGYAIADDGSLTILDADGKTGETPAGSMPIDAAFERRGDFLYVLSGGSNTITAFRRGEDGSLTSLGSTGGLPGGSVGLAAR
jgi:6-phosphogluconolactonase (cycloisomerase 2 family)